MPGLESFNAGAGVRCPFRRQNRSPTIARSSPIARIDVFGIEGARASAARRIRTRLEDLGHVAREIPDAIGLLIDSGRKSGAIRADADPSDLPRPLVGFASVNIGSEERASARRLIDILVDGLRGSGRPT